ncbi:MAG: YcxB family protein [Lachnospiraceae bacterium]|nr:YcxB family protein [Lachnospiraceae bacterium]
MVECEVKIGAADLYDYNLKYTYGKFINILAEVAGLVAVVYGIKAANYPLAVIGAVVVAYLPVTLWLRSAQTAALLPAFKKPLHYRLDDDGLTVSQGEESQTIKWEDCLKAVSTSRSILVFTSKTGATIFPRAQLGDKTTLVIQCISRNMSPDRVNIKC